MKNTTVVSILFLIITPLSGCVFYPGQHLDLAGKKIIAAEDANDRLEKRIDVYPLTPSLIEKLRPSVLKSQANPNLDEQVKNWEYRIGVGDILTVTVWDHPE
ncbi:polysaccharide export protein Wza, partial [Enterobacter hormaechei]|nr:polysaccharide export protein Wza [Enterobacter hormaechei]MBJ6483536.1 polysaccharide export protein Wza [Enterobacter hormaechei]